jgi:hypothetical protein
VKRASRIACIAAWRAGAALHHVKQLKAHGRTKGAQTWPDYLEAKGWPDSPRTADNYIRIYRHAEMSEARALEMTLADAYVLVGVYRPREPQAEESDEPALPEQSTPATKTTTGGRKTPARPVTSDNLLSRITKASDALFDIANAKRIEGLDELPPEKHEKLLKDALAELTAIDNAIKALRDKLPKTFAPPAVKVARKQNKTSKAHSATSTA